MLIRDLIISITTYKGFSPEQTANLKIKDYAKLLNESINSNYLINDYYNKGSFVSMYGEEYKNKPSVILLGCSYTYGTNLDEKDKLNVQLAKYIKTPVYNLGLPGGGPREIIHILNNDKLLEEMNIDKNNVKYFIYIYIGDHQRRIYSDLRSLVPQYVKHNNELKQIKTIKFIDKLMITKAIKGYYADNFVKLEDFWDNEVVYIKNMQELISKKFSNGEMPTKLVILDYEDWGNEDWSQISDIEGIEVIHLKDLADIDVEKLPYIVWEGDDHPSALVWQTIIPKLVERIEK